MCHRFTYYHLLCDYFFMTILGCSVKDQDNIHCQEPLSTIEKNWSQTMIIHIINWPRDLPEINTT